MSKTGAGKLKGMAMDDPARTRHAAEAARQAGMASSEAGALSPLESDSDLKDIVLQCKQDIEAQTRTFTDTQDRITAVLNTITTYNDRLVNVENKVGSVGDKLDTLAEKVNGLEIEINQLKQENQELREYKRRPKPYLYERTIVVYGAEKEQAELNGSENEADDARRMIAYNICKYGLKIDPVPPIIAVMRLPHQNENSAPGLKIEFETEDVREKVLKGTRNLAAPSPFSSLVVRRSMNEGERSFMRTYKTLRISMQTQGIEIPYMYPNGNLRRGRFQFQANPVAPAPTLRPEGPPTAAAAVTLMPRLPGAGRGGFRPPRVGLNILGLPH
jgi:hypothetical protein